MKMKASVSGLRDLDAALGELSKGTARNTLRRVLVKAGQPIADAAAAMAPDDPSTGAPDLKSSIAVGTKLTGRQQRLHRRETRDDRAFAEAFVGTNDPAAVPQEFGTEKHGPQPFMRPAWDQEQNTALDVIKEELGGEIEKAAARARRKAARLAAKG